MTLQVTADVTMAIGVSVLIIERGWAILKALRDSKPVTVNGNTRSYITDRELTEHCRREHADFNHAFGEIRTGIGSLHEKVNGYHTEVKDSIAVLDKRVTVAELRRRDDEE